MLDYKTYLDKNSYLTNWDMYKKTLEDLILELDKVFNKVTVEKKLDKEELLFNINYFNNLVRVIEIRFSNNTYLESNINKLIAVDTLFNNTVYLLVYHRVEFKETINDYYNSFRPLINILSTFKFIKEDFLDTFSSIYSDFCTKAVRLELSERVHYCFGFLGFIKFTAKLVEISTIDKQDDIYDKLDIYYDLTSRMILDYFVDFKLEEVASRENI